MYWYLNRKKLTLEKKIQPIQAQSLPSSDTIAQLHVRAEIAVIGVVALWIDVQPPPRSDRIGVLLRQHDGRRRVPNVADGDHVAVVFTGTMQRFCGVY